MEKGRLEAFSDGVIAIIITIMVLELKVPQGNNLAALLPLIPVFLSYVLSFVFIGIYWNNHHHLLQAIRHVNGRILLANLHLLFWLSLIPFATGWMGKNNFAAFPVAFYGTILLLSAIAYYILTHALINHHGKDSTLATAIGRDSKGKVSIISCILAILLAFINPRLSCFLYIMMASMWLFPDRRIEKTLTRYKVSDANDDYPNIP
ncbi:MAG: TMEM175 family protein [Waterburya sp.]